MFIVASCGGATCDPLDYADNDIGFNPRARGGRDKVIAVAGGILHRFQSTRPRGARRRYRQAMSHASWVSIHAPAGGATSPAYRKTAQKRVSIHAPAGGATQEIEKIIQRSRVSIHAPAGGATWNVHFPPDRCKCFNPRARGGRDKMAATDAIGTAMFQSTRPRGARHPKSTERAKKVESFNPRARGGRDKNRRKDMGRHQLVSIHAPAGGATDNIR